MGDVKDVNKIQIFRRRKKLYIAYVIDMGKLVAMNVKYPYLAKHYAYIRRTTDKQRAKQR